MAMHKSVKALLLASVSLSVICGTPLVRWAVKSRAQHLEAQNDAREHVRKHIQ
jgi:hypothetical protein